MNKIQFKTRKEVSDFLKEKNIDTTNWTEEKWQSINKSQAEIHIQALAESMWDAMNESIPKELKAGEWHIPFGDKISSNVMDWFSDIKDQAYWLGKDMTPLFLKVATARCARLSYMTFDGEINYKKDIQLHDRLLLDKHMSPFEHCAKAMSEEEYFSFIKGKVHFENNVDYITIVEENPSRKIVGWCNNFKGFIQYRYLIENGLSI